VAAADLALIEEYAHEMQDAGKQVVPALETARLLWSQLEDEMQKLVEESASADEMFRAFSAMKQAIERDSTTRERLIGRLEETSQRFVASIENNLDTNRDVVSEG
jgi:ABC-type transporter Mla subunit MlaD